MTMSNDEMKIESAELAAAEAEVEAAAGPAEPPSESTAEKGVAKKPPEPVKKTCSAGLTAWMKRMQVSIAFTSYQSGRLYLLGSDTSGRLSFHERIYQRAMGVVGNGQRLFMG